MTDLAAIPSYQLYGETRVFPDLLHVERIIDRAAGLDWQIAPHRHLHLHQIFLLQSGEVRLTVDGVAQAVDTPALINLPRQTVHGFRFSAGTEGFVLTLPMAEFPELFDPASETADAALLFFVAPAAPVLADLFDDLSCCHASAQPFRRTRLRAMAGLILAHAAAAGAADQPARPGRGDPRIARFAELVAQHFRDRWSVADYARQLGLSPRHLSRLCHGETGLAAQAFVESQVIREACRLLVYTRMSVASIGYQIGFDDPSYFSRSFQRAIGLSPRAYRARFDG